MLNGNTLMESLEHDDGMPENILVVAFYLVTRESGSFFQHLATLIESNDNQEEYIVPT